VQANQAVEVLMSAGVTGSLKTLLSPVAMASGTEDIPAVSVGKDWSCSDYAMAAGALALAAGVLTFGVSFELITAAIWVARAGKASAALNLAARAWGMYGLADCTGWI